MRVVVTGASGMIGSAAVRVLRGAGHDVTACDQFMPREPDPDFVLVDLMDRWQTAAVLKGADAVCHLGEVANDVVRLPRNEIFSRNTTIAPQVMQLAAESGIRKIVYTSSCQVYGTWGVGPGPLADKMPPAACLPIVETHPLRPQNVYALSKVTNESYARHLADVRPDLSVAAFRFPYVLAPRSTEQVKCWADRGGPPADGMGSVLTVEDAARAYLKWLEGGHVGFDAYHFGSPEILSILPLRELIAKSYPGTPAVPVVWSEYQSPLVCDKARAHFGWVPMDNPIDQYRAIRRT